jgi:hypothetical protein
MIGHEYLQEHRYRHEDCRHEMAIPAGNQLRDVSHRVDVGGDIQRVGDEQEHHHALQHHGRESGLYIGGESSASGAAEDGAHRLYRRHQRIGEWHGPEDVKTELGSRLRVGGDAARVVIGRAGYEPWAYSRQGVRFYALPERAERIAVAARAKCAQALFPVRP